MRFRFNNFDCEIDESFAVKNCMILNFTAMLQFCTSKLHCTFIALLRNGKPGIQETSPHVATHRSQIPRNLSTGNFHNLPIIRRRPTRIR